MENLKTALEIITNNYIRDLTIDKDVQFMSNERDVESGWNACKMSISSVLSKLDDLSGDFEESHELLTNKLIENLEIYDNGDDVMIVAGGLTIQLHEGEYRSDLGCLVTDDDGDELDFASLEKVISASEKLYRESDDSVTLKKGNFTYELSLKNEEIRRLNSNFINSATSSYQNKFDLVENIADIELEKDEEGQDFRYMIERDDENGCFKFLLYVDFEHLAERQIKEDTLILSELTKKQINELSVFDDYKVISVFANDDDDEY